MRLLLPLLLLVGCATTNQYGYEESETCPSQMTTEQRGSGAVRCKALCASYGRGYATFDSWCRCVCQPESRPVEGGT